MHDNSSLSTSGIRVPYTLPVVPRKRDSRNQSTPGPSHSDHDCSLATRSRLVSLPGVPNPAFLWLPIKFSQGQQRPQGLDVSFRSNVMRTSLPCTSELHFGTFRALGEDQTEAQTTAPATLILIRSICAGIGDIKCSHIAGKRIPIY